MRRAVWAGRIWRRGEEELFVKAAPMTQKPAFRLMKLGDVQSVYHLQMPRWLFTDRAIRPCPLSQGGLYLPAQPFPALQAQRLDQ